MNDSKFKDQSCRLYEQFRVMDDINNSSSSIEVVVDMNKSVSRELKALNAMNNSEHWMIWLILGRELKALDAKGLNAMNYLASWMTWMTPSH